MTVKTLIKRAAIFCVWPIIVAVISMVLNPPFIPYEVFAIVSGVFWGLIIYSVWAPHTK